MKADADLRGLQLPTSWCAYIAAALVALLLIRLVLAGLRASERDSGERWPAWWSFFWGFGYSRPASSRGGGNDYMQPAVVGFLELLVYPVLMAFNPLFVGAWLAFKVVPTVNWASSRNVYQRFLIGNALVLIASFFMMRCFIPLAASP